MSNQLDDFFKNKLQQRTFDYDDSAWEEARLLIEKEESRKKRRFWIMSFAGLFLISFVGLVAYQMGKGSSVSDTIPVAPVKIESSKESSIKDTQTKNTIAQKALPIQEVKASTSQDINASSIPKNINRESTRKSKQDKSYSKRQRQEIIAGSNSIKSTIKSKSNFADALGVETDISLSSEPITTYSNPIYVSPPTPGLSNSVRENNPIIDVPQLMPIVLNRALDIEQSETNWSDLMPALVTKNDGLPMISPFQKWSFGLRGGAALIPFSFSDMEGGVFASYHFNRNLSVSLQPQYAYQKLEEATLESTEIYSFGLKSSAYSLKAESIRSLRAPLMISYAFGNGSFDLADKISNRYLRNRLSLGLAYTYLDGVTGSISVKEASNVSSEYQTGWLDASNFNRHNAEVLIGYERFFTERLSLGIQARYRMKDQFSDSFTLANPSVVQPGPLYFGIQTYFKLF